MSHSRLFTGWRIELFGGPVARQGDVTINRFRSQNIAALLAYLCLFRNRRHTREELADLLWPDEMVETGRANLRTALAFLRRQLEPAGIPTGAVLVADGQTYLSIHPEGVVTDVMEFEAAIAAGDDARAVGLYRAPLLPGISASWVTAERERFAEAYRAAQERLAGSRTAPSPANPHLTEAGTATPSVPRLLPTIGTRFFGRESELAEIRGVLGAGTIPPLSRLITLTGPGGSGKTRLAIEAARELADAFPGGTYFIPMADIREAERLPDTVAEAMRVSLSAHVSSREAIVHVLQTAPGPVLFVLDNAEDIAKAAADFVYGLLSDVSGLSCLVTSRQKLLLDGEREIPIAPLPVPELPGTPERLLEFPSVQLFVSRAQAIRPDFQLTPRNSEAIVALCQRLEGIPLAVELAAGWAQTLTVTQMLERLNHRFELLVSRRRDLPPRHATLRAAIESSIRLLPDDVQRFFAKLSIFTGGWNIAAAESVTDDPATVEHLALLRDHSLLRTLDGPDDEMRFRMLETLREFAAEQLTGPERTALQERHTDFFLSFAEEVMPLLKKADQKTHLDRLEADHPNFRSVLAHCRQTTGSEDKGLRLVRALYRFWTLRGHFREGIAVTEALLAHNPEKQNPVCRANALNSLGIMLRHIGQQETARLHMKEALQIWRELNDLGGISSALANLGTIANNLEDFETAKIYLTEALVLSREIGREHAVAICLNNLGMIARRQGDLAAARTSLESSLTLMQSLQDAAGISQNYYNLGGLACAMGDSQTGRAYLQEALRLNLELQNPEGIAACLIAIAFSRAGDLSEAEEDANLLGVTETLREEFDIPLLTDERAEYENGAARLQAILGDARFADAVAAGRTLSRRAVLCRLLGDPDAEIAMPTVRGIAP